MSRISQKTFQILLYTLGVLVLLQTVFFTAAYLYGVTTTIQWITGHPALALFLAATIFAALPVYNETENKLKQIWKETSKATLIVTITSFLVYYRSFVVTPNGPFEAMLYNIGGRAWYLTGLLLALNLIGLPVASTFVSDE